MSVAPLLVLTHSFPPDAGGEAEYVYQFCRELDGHKTVVSYRFARPTLRTGEFSCRPLAGFRVIRVFCPPLFPWAARAFALDAARKICRRDKPRLILCGNARMAGIARTLKRSLGIPYVVLTHGRDVIGTDLSDGGLERVLRPARTVIAPSGFTREQILLRCPDLPEVRVIPPVVPPPLRLPDAEQAKRRLGLEGRKVLLTVARLSAHAAHKGHDLVLMALADVVRRYPETVYAVVGEGASARPLEGLARRLGLAGHVRFFEHDRRRLDDFYAACDIYVMPSRHDRRTGAVEGFGIVFVEAALHGKPCVGGRSGGIRDAVEDGRTGLLVDPLDPGRIRDAILALLEDPARARSMGEEGRRRALAKYGPDRLGPRIRESVAPTQPRRTLFVHHAATPYGASRSLLESVRAVQARSEVLVALPGRGPLTALLEREGVRYAILPLCVVYYCSLAKSLPTHGAAAWLRGLGHLIAQALRVPANVTRLRRLIRDFDPDVVVINSATLLVSGWAARGSGRRVAWHVREVIGTEASRLMKRLIAGVLGRSSDVLIANSEYSRRDLESIGLAKARLVPNGLDADRFGPKRPLDPSGIRNVGWVGQIYRQKGWHVLAEAAFLLHPRRPDWTYLVVGASSGRRAGTPPRADQEEAVFRRVVRDFGLEKNFCFAGEQSDPEPWYRRMDCLVAPSVAPESFGRVLIEAMVCGVPVIASRIGAYPEIVEDGLTGILVEPADPRALAEAMDALLGDPGRLEAMGRAARESVRRRFDARSVAGRLWDAYGGSPVPDRPAREISV